MHPKKKNLLPRLRHQPTTLFPLSSRSRSRSPFSLHAADDHHASRRLRSVPRRRRSAPIRLRPATPLLQAVGKMGRRKKNGSNLKSGICKASTLREENLGKKEVDVRSILRIKHLQKLAAWAGGEGGIPPLGAFFGYHLAANTEVLGVPLDKSSFFCQRCESNLQPGFNCTIRIEKCKNKRPKRSNEKPNNFQNNVIYKCSFCHYGNSVKGAPKGHLKTLLSLKESTSDLALTDNQDPASKSNLSSISANDDSIAGDYPDQKKKTPILSKNKRKLEELECGKLQLSSCSKGSSRRKRKTWSSLKDIVGKEEAESNENVSNYVIPFFIQA